MDRDTYIAASASVTGDVRLGRGCSVWHGAVIRADAGPVRLGPRSNVQDNATIHVDHGFPVHLGEGVTVGHNAVVHGCDVGDNTVIGMGAIVLNGAKVGSGCIIGAGSLVTQGAVIPDGSLALGSPARVRRRLTPEEVAANAENAEEYVRMAREQLG